MKRIFEKIKTQIIIKELRPQGGQVETLYSIGGYLGRNELFEVNHSMVLKVFHHESDIRCHAETRAYRLLQNKAFPTANFLGAGRFSCGSPWLLMEKIKGESFDRVALLPRQKKEEMIEKMASLLAQMHNYSVARYGQENKPAKDEKKIVNKLKKFDFKDKALVRSSIKEWKYLACHAGDEHRSLIHMDFCGRNILCRFNESNVRVNGIIDFERSCLGEPEQDLSFIFFKELMPNPELAPLFFSTYLDRYRKRDISAEKISYYLYGLLLRICSWAFHDDPKYCGSALDALTRLNEGLSIADYI